MTLGRTLLRKQKLWTEKDKQRLANRTEIDEDGSYRVLHPTKGWRYFGVNGYSGADGTPHAAAIDSLWKWLMSKSRPVKKVKRIPSRKKPEKNAAYYKSGVMPKHLRVQYD